MAYDHNIKAGNEGDIVKHVALIAALNSIISTNDITIFRYVAEKIRRLATIRTYINK